MAALDPRKLASWCGGEWCGAVPATVAGVSHDSRRIEKGALYIALKGDRFDGHAFVADAFGAGAAAAVVNRDWCPPAGTPLGPLLRVDRPAEALQDMARGYRQSQTARIIGITGSAGKTTVKELTAAMLETTLPTASTRGNWNNDIGLPLSLLAMQNNTKAGVFELGTNHPGEMRTLCRVLQPTWGMVTNIGAGHITFFGSIEAIAREKAVLLESLPADGCAILNRDSACFELLRGAAPCATITVSANAEEKADYVCRERDTAARTARIRETASGEEAMLTDLLPGEHNVTNVLLATAVARGHGVAWPEIAQAVHAFKSLPMRWEQLCMGGVTVINDAYNSNPLSVRAALAAFAETHTEGAKWIVLGDMLELGRHEEIEHRGLGACLAKGPWRGIITVGAGGAWIADGLQEAGLPAEVLHRCCCNEDAVKVLAAQARPGDAVLLKASRGMHLEEVVDGFRTRCNSQ